MKYTKHHTSKISAKKLESSLSTAQAGGLDEEDKRLILEALKVHIKENPIPDIVKNVPIKSPWNVYSMRIVMPMAACFLILVLAGSSVFAAQDSLPGDVLYPVKIHISEALEELFTHGVQANAAVQAKHAITRLKEAEQLAAKNKLDSDKKNDLAAAFKHREGMFRNKIKVMKVEGDVSGSILMSADFQNSLVHHQDILKSIANLQPNVSKEVGEISQVIHDSLDNEFREDGRIIDFKANPIVHKIMQPKSENKQDASPDKKSEHSEELDSSTHSNTEETNGNSGDQHLDASVNSSTTITTPPANPNNTVPPVNIELHGNAGSSLHLGL